jgi:glycogen debranching enzyme
MSNGLVQILDGNTFVVSDSNGDIEASLTDPTGLFSFDTRFLSKWVLTIDGQRLNALSVDDLQYFETRFFLVQGSGTVYVDAKLSVIRRRAVGNGFHEELTLLNHDDKPVDLAVRIEAGSDFADLFEVKDALAKKGKYSARVQGGRLLLGYERETFRRETAISATARPGSTRVASHSAHASSRKANGAPILTSSPPRAPAGPTSSRSTHAARNERGRAWS